MTEPTTLFTDSQEHENFVCQWQELFSLLPSRADRLEMFNVISQAGGDFIVAQIDDPAAAFEGARYLGYSLKLSDTVLRVLAACRAGEPFDSALSVIHASAPSAHDGPSNLST